MNEKQIKIVAPIPIGTRVRMVQTTSTGTVVGEMKPTGIDGGLRVPIRWDNSGVTNDWHPDFLRSENSPESEDPDEVTNGALVRRRSKQYMSGGILHVEKAGFFPSKK